MAEIHNLDEGLIEYFEFILGGYKYKFRHLTAEEADGFSKIEVKENLSALSYLSKFISSDDPKAPNFDVVSKKMTIQTLKKFMNMITSEFSK